MGDMLYSRPISNDRTLCISPLPNSAIEREMTLTRANQYSYYLYETDASAERGVVILAKIVSEDAAFRLRESLEASLR